MSRDFHSFQKAVNAQFARMAKGELLCVGLNKDKLWEKYLKSFPAGTNPIVRERTEHDCSCCRQFIRNMGNVVSVIDGQLVTIWDADIRDPVYAEVAAKLARAIKKSPIEDYFVHYQQRQGTESNVEVTEKGTITWSHFYVDVPLKNAGRSFIVDKKRVDSVTGDLRTTREVFDRGLRELTLDAVETVRDVIAQGSLYRGNDFKHMIEGFLKHKVAYDALPEADRELYAWLHALTIDTNIARIRNVSIGTLLIDLSAGVDIEDAVRKFEGSIMAPQNYKRPTALVSQKMIADAQKKIEELGLATALHRRYAHISDVSVKDVIFVDRSLRKSLKGSKLFDDLPTKERMPKNYAKAEKVGIDEFLKNVVPLAESIEVLVENEHEPNLVSVVAPVEKTEARLFQWGNDFSWAYNGDVADSIRERVKKAGGNVTGDFCCRLAWGNYDDLDLHMIEETSGRPFGKYEIFFGNRGSLSPSGGELDVDMNAGGGTTREPVENIFYSRLANMHHGSYMLFVHQYAKRESADVGFTVEVDILGATTTFSYPKAVRDGQRIEVARFVRDANGLRIDKEFLQSTQAPRKMWGIDTQKFHRVSAITLSPNYWGNKGVGNKHYFFLIDGCVNEGTPRGFFNEFLRSELTPHRKVIELVGNRARVEPTSDQLSGLGFSDTKRASIKVRVSGSFNRTLEVAF